MLFVIANKLSPPPSFSADWRTAYYHGLYGNNNNNQDGILMGVIVNDTIDIQPLRLRNQLENPGAKEEVMAIRKGCWSIFRSLPQLPLTALMQIPEGNFIYWRVYRVVPCSKYWWDITCIAF